MSKDKQNDVATSTKPVLSGVEMLSTSLAGKRVGYKETKLGWVPEDWSTPTIGEVFEFLKTLSFSRAQLNYDDENETYYIHYGDIHATYKTPTLDFEIIKSVPRLNSDVALPASVQYLENGDVIIADASEDYDGVGTAIELKNIDKKKVISGLHTFALRDKEELTVEGFRTYIFKNPIVKKALKTIATGSKVFGISKGNVQKFEIVLPTLPEQQKIARILNTWDKAITAQEKLIAQKQALKNGLMQQLLTGKKRFAGFEEEWEEKSFKDFMKINQGLQIPISKRHLENIPNSYFYITNEFLRKDSNYKYYILNPSESVKCNVKDILMTRTGNTGMVVTGVKGVFHNNFFKISFQKDRVNKEFLFYILNSDRIQYTIKKLAGTSTIPDLNHSEFYGITIMLPSIKEQQMISDTLKSCDIELSTLISKKLKLKKQKQGIMQQLLTGKKRVKI